MRSKKGIWMVVLLSAVILIAGGAVPPMVQAQSKEPVKMGISVPIAFAATIAEIKRIGTRRAP